MEVPEHRALLGVDVVGSARNEGYHLNAVPVAVEELVRGALAEADVEDADLVEWEPTGDGALLTLSSGKLGAVLDAAHHLDLLAAERNRWHRPDVRLRLAVEVGPVGPRPGFYAPKISVTRLLDASAFKDLVARCEGMTTALIVSDGALRAAFGGDHTTHVRRTDFVPLAVREKEFDGMAWVRVPGFDPKSLEALAGQPSPEAPDHEETYRGMRVTNTATGGFTGVQAGVVHGGINIGGRT